MKQPFQLLSQVKHSNFLIFQPFRSNTFWERKKREREKQTVTSVRRTERGRLCNLKKERQLGRGSSPESKSRAFIRRLSNPAISITLSIFLVLVRFPLADFCFFYKYTNLNFFGKNPIIMWWKLRSVDRTKYREIDNDWSVISEICSYFPLTHFCLAPGFVRLVRDTPTLLPELPSTTPTSRSPLVQKKQQRAMDLYRHRSFARMHSDGPHRPILA